jgi:hypothetical protein
MILRDHDRFPGKNRGQTVVIIELGPGAGAFGVAGWDSGVGFREGDCPGLP